MKKGLVKGLGISFLLLIIVGAGAAWYLNKIIYGEAVPSDKESYELYVPSGADFNTLFDSLKMNNLINDGNAFKWVAGQMKFGEKIKSGKYIIKGGLSNRELISQLRLGEESSEKVVVNSHRDLNRIAGAAGHKLELDSVDLMKLFNDDSFLETINYNKSNISSMILPDTYEFYWDTNAEQFIKKMKAEYDKFWDDEKLAKAQALDMTSFEVTTLASIVQEEVYHNEEMDDIAKVYLNRLDLNMALQADPTVKFAVGDFTIKRVLNKHLEVDSPYNTYMYPGLPPGPICIPSKTAINAVLNPAEHNYLYFCAKEDFSMYHSFARNLKQHLINAKNYQNALNRKKIFK